MKPKALIGAAVVALGVSLTAAPAHAVMIDGQLDIVGIVDVQASDFQLGGVLDFVGNGTVIISLGDFAAFVSAGDTATLNDLTFTPPEDVYTVGGFTFTANSYFDFDNVIPGRGFASNGILTGNGFDPTPGLLTLTTQSNNVNQLIASFSCDRVSAADGARRPRFRHAAPFGNRLTGSG